MLSRNVKKRVYEDYQAAGACEQDKVSFSEAERPALGPKASLVIDMVLEWLKGATGVFSAGDRGAARSPAQARPPARRVRIQEDAKAAAAARVTREKEKARKDTPRKKNQSRAPSSRLKDDFVVDKKVLGEGHYGVVRRCSPRADPSAPARKSQPATRVRPRYTRRSASAVSRSFGRRERRTDGGRWASRRRHLIKTTSDRGTVNV